MRKASPMKNEILKQLLLAHADGDDAAFPESGAPARVCRERGGTIFGSRKIFRSIVAKLPSQRRPTVVDIAAPRGELGDVLDGGYRQERLADIVLSEKARALFERVLHENRSREKLSASASLRAGRFSSMDRQDAERHLALAFSQVRWGCRS